MTRFQFRAELGRIYKEQHAALLALAQSITGQSQMAEDALHDAVTRLWTMEDQPAGDMTAYFFAAVRNAAIDQHRALKKTIMQPMEVLRDGNHRPVSSSQSGSPPEMPRVAIREAVGTLPEHYRAVVSLHVFGGLTFREIATALEEPLGTVTSRYRRALRRLARLLQEAETDGG
jgi:RNA polymerase sigma-70 factor (ECF subfamily)